MIIPREDVLKIIQASDMPVLLKAGVSAFLKALPQEKFDELTAQIFEAGSAVMKDDPTASTKLGALGIPPNIAATLIKEAKARAH